MKIKISFVGIILLIFCFSLLTWSSCVKVRTDVVAPSQPAGNQPPIISSLTSSVKQTYPGGSVNIQSIVTDPNEDKINFKWSATGGTFVEQGRPNTTWQAPGQFGDYEIKLTVDDGKGATAEQTLMIKVSANHPPVINSLVANPASLQFAMPTTITCVATDQDGDTLTYQWSAREGTITGEGNKVTWFSPSKNGNFSIIVTVLDGKGAEAKQELIIPVAASSAVQVINPESKESGTVDSTGDKNTGLYKAGDDDKNIGYRAYFSYNIFPLWGMEIKQARLKFVNGRQVGDPFDPVTGLGVFRVMTNNYGKTLPRYGPIVGSPLQRDQSHLNKMIQELDVTPELVNCVSDRLERAQFEAAFMKTTNGNGIAEFVQWQDVLLEVTAVPK